MSSKPTRIKTPIGRLVQGSLYRGSTKDRDGNTLVYKNGAKVGQPRTSYYFALAIRKGTEQHWSQTPWGAVIYKVGVEAFPNVYQSRNFAWKITDGDSVEPNTEGVRPVDCQGFAGCWILRFSSSLTPQVCTAKGEEYITQENFVNLGDFVEVAATVAGNESSQQPGVYINGVCVAFRAYGERIVVGIDPASVGFGEEPLPAGASSVPLGEAPMAAVAPMAVPAHAGLAPAAPMTTPPPYPGIVQQAAAAPAPAAPMAPPPAPIAPPAPMRVMTAEAKGFSYESYKAAGWSDDQLIQQGMMVI